MKRYRLGLILLTIIVGFSFTSCETDDYWKSGTLDIKFDLHPDTYDGYVQVTTIVRDVEIAEFNPSREDIIDIQLNDAWLEMSNFKRGDYIERFYIEAQGIGTFSFETPISIRETGQIVTVDNNAYFNFMQDVMNKLAYNKSIRITVTMYTRIYDGGPIYFDMKNNLDLRLTD